MFGNNAERIFDNLRLGILETDFKLRITYASPRCEHLFEASPGIGQNLFNDVQPVNKDQSKARRHFLGRLNGDRKAPIEDHYRFWKADGEILHALVSADPLLNGKKVRGIRLEIRDISHFVKRLVIPLATSNEPVEFEAMIFDSKDEKAKRSDRLVSGLKRLDKFGNMLPPRITRSTDCMDKTKRAMVYEAWRSYLSTFYNTQYKVQLIEQETFGLHLSDSEKANYVGITRERYNALKKKLVRL